MRCVRKAFYSIWLFENPHAYSHERETVQMPRMREGVSSSEWSKVPHAHSTSLLAFRKSTFTYAPYSTKPIFFSFFPKKQTSFFATNFPLFLSFNGRHEQRERVHERRALAVEVSKETTARTGIIISSITRVFVFVELLYCFCL